MKLRTGFPAVLWQGGIVNAGKIDLNEIVLHDPAIVCAKEVIRFKIAPWQALSVWWVEVDESTRCLCNQ